VTVTDRVKRILAAEWKVEPEDIPDDAALNRYEHWDSLGHIAVMLALRARCGLELTPERVQGLNSIARIVEALEAGGGRGPAPAAAPEPGPGSVDPAWEERIYARGRHLNRYPHHAVVGFVLGTFGEAPDRGAVRILELGCGAGNNLWFAAREGFTVAGIDGSPTAVAHARRRFAGDGLAGDLRVGDFAAPLPWPEAHFDAVLDRGSLTSARGDAVAAALRESQRVLKPGGRLFSMIYSSEHADRAYGRDLGDGTHTGFTGGYFQDLGVVYFATRRDIDRLYGSLFRIDSLLHVRDTDALGDGRVVNALWTVRCTKAGA
jgi:SAM-dependent methyltransferase/acyl carrier protein